jgi:hypothetical protein
MQAADQVRVSWISELCGLTTENGLDEGVMEEGVLHIKLRKTAVESTVVVDPGALSETPEDRLKVLQ